MQQHRESHEHREAYTGKTEKETRPNLLAREPSPPPTPLNQLYLSKHNIKVQHQQNR